MTDSVSAGRGELEGPPDPRNRSAFEAWLANQPRQWSVVLVARAALRVLPLMPRDKILSTLILPVFRATAVALFISKYPNRATGRSASAASAQIPPTLALSGIPFAAAANAASAAASGSASLASSYTAAASVASLSASISVKHDAQQLHDRASTPEQLADALLWPTPSPPRIGGAWQVMAGALRELGPHWTVWIDWYDDILAGAATTEEEDAAFTDVPGELPWGDGAEAVNDEIARRLRAIRGSSWLEPPLPPPELEAEVRKALTVSRLADVASPQPSIAASGQLDAGPNLPFDVPTVDDDLSTLPIRQRNLIKGILSDLPSNAPRYLERFLRAYEDELKTRGTQPILGLLKDDADIIAAAVGAPNAADEWLEPGMRKAFDRFADNHHLFVEHFPLDVEREQLYAETSVDEEQAIGQLISEPFESVARAVHEEHEVGTVTGDYLAVMDKMTEFARVLSTQPTLAPDRQSLSAPPEIKIGSEDRIQPVSAKKRAILGGLGFFERSLALVSGAVSLATTDYGRFAAVLQSAIDSLSRLLR